MGFCKIKKAAFFEDFRNLKGLNFEIFLSKTIIL